LHHNARYRFLVFSEFQILDLTGPLAAFEMPTRTVTPRHIGCMSCPSRVGTERIGSGRVDTLIVVGEQEPFSGTEGVPTENRKAGREPRKTGCSACLTKQHEFSRGHRRDAPVDCPRYAKEAVSFFSCSI